jgi:hypothetical protein
VNAPTAFGDVQLPARPIADGSAEGDDLLWRVRMNS